MRPLRSFVSILLLGGLLAGCGDSEKPLVMPDVTGKQLDTALSDIKRAGIDDEVEVVGGGVFGVVDKSNWTVCEQLPTAGQSPEGSPRLTVGRECTETGKTTSQSETDQKPDPTDSASPSAEPDESSSPQSVGGSEITVADNSDFASLVALTDTCSPEIARFAETYSGRTVKFDASIDALANHGNYKTRYDILISYGDFSETTSTGPSFQLRDVNTVSDLGITGDNEHDTIGVGDNITLTATVDRYVEQQCLLLLKPISTVFR